MKTKTSVTIFVLAAVGFFAIQAQASEIRFDGPNSGMPSPQISPNHAISGIKPTVLAGIRLYVAKFDAPSPWPYDYNSLTYTVRWATKLHQGTIEGSRPAKFCSRDVIFCGASADPEESDDCKEHEAEYRNYPHDADGNIPGFLCESQISFGEIGQLTVRIEGSDKTRLYEGSTPLKLVFRSKSQWLPDSTKYQVAPIDGVRWNPEVSVLDYGDRKGPFYFQGGFQVRLSGAGVTDDHGSARVNLDRVETSPEDTWISIDPSGASVLLSTQKSPSRRLHGDESLATFELQPF